MYLKRDYLQTKYSSERNHSGPLLYRQKRDTNNLPLGMRVFLVNVICVFIIFIIFSEKNTLGIGSYLHIFLMFFLYAVDDTSEGAVVQRRGRFKVTSADISPMVCIEFGWWICFFPNLLLML